MQSDSIITVVVKSMERHNHLQVISTQMEHRRDQPRRYAYYECDCGKTGSAQYYKIKNGITTTCGCGSRARFLGNKLRATHLMTKTRTYKSWQSMKDRCTNPHNIDYHHYGGRGITFTERWLSFENFLEDMGERPDGRTLDRIDVNGNYCKENCRWADTLTQRHNRRV